MGPPWTNRTHCSSYSQQAAFSNRRQFTINLPLNEIREYSQWLRGANYNVANTLSQDNNRTEDKLTQIRNCSAAKWDRLMVILASATAARQVTVGANTLDSKTWAWNHYSGYCWSRDNLRQPFPQRHVPNSPHWNHRRFRRGCASRTISLTTWCSPGWKHSLRNTLNHMAAVFRENGHDNPKRDTEHNIAGLLRRQQRSYKKYNPKEVQQKALHVWVLWLVLSSKSKNFAKQWWTCRSRPLLGDALVRVRKSTWNRAKPNEDEATVH